MKKLQKRKRSNPTSTQIAHERYLLKQNIITYLVKLNKKIIIIKNQNLDRLSRDDLKDLYDKLYWMDYQLKFVESDTKDK